MTSESVVIDLFNETDYCEQELTSQLKRLLN